MEETNNLHFLIFSESVELLSYQAVTSRDELGLKMIKMRGSLRLKKCG